jgi:hypothetical protein
MGNLTIFKGISWKIQWKIQLEKQVENPAPISPKHSKKIILNPKEKSNSQNIPVLAIPVEGGESACSTVTMPTTQKKSCLDTFACFINK